LLNASTARLGARLAKHAPFATYGHSSEHFIFLLFHTEQRPGSISEIIISKQTKLSTREKRKDYTMSQDNRQYTRMPKAASRLAFAAAAPVRNAIGYFKEMKMGKPRVLLAAAVATFASTFFVNQSYACVNGSTKCLTHMVYVCQYGYWVVSMGVCHSNDSQEELFGSHKFDVKYSVPAETTGAKPAPFKFLVNWRSH
jgi:hypothetical protein